MPDSRRRLAHGRAFRGLSVAVGLTLKVLFCCAQPLRLTPTSATATAQENLIGFYPCS